MNKQQVSVCFLAVQVTVVLVQDFNRTSVKNVDVLDDVDWYQTLVVNLGSHIGNVRQSKADLVRRAWPSRRPRKGDKEEKREMCIMF